MKKIFLFAAVALGMIACSENSSSNGNAEKKFALQLNEDCSEFKADSSVWEALQDGDLEKLKESIANCASLDMSLYDSTFSLDHFLFVGNSDSLIIYLLQNGLDSVGRDKWNVFATSAVLAEDTLMVRYAIDNGYPIIGTTVRAAILMTMNGFLGSEVGRYWYGELIGLIDNVDSVRQNIAFDFSILHEFCNESTFRYLSESDQLFYFQDLIDRGYSVNQKWSGHDTELDCCEYGGKYQSDLQKKFSEILIKAGADTSLVDR